MIFLGKKADTPEVRRQNSFDRLGGAKSGIPHAKAGLRTAKRLRWTPQSRNGRGAYPSVPVAKTEAEDPVSDGIIKQFEAKLQI